MPNGRLHKALAFFGTVAIASLLIWFAPMTERPAEAQSTPTTTYAPPTTRPVVYIASPYTRGDPAVNTHFQCRIFDQLINDGVVWPVAPLWSHFQHTIYPRPYKDWVEYDLAMIQRYDACLRLDSDEPRLNYKESQSSGADKEVEEFRRQGKPVFYSIDDLYRWAKAK